MQEEYDTPLYKYAILLIHVKYVKFDIFIFWEKKCGSKYHLEKSRTILKLLKQKFNRQRT